VSHIRLRRLVPFVSAILCLAVLGRPLAASTPGDSSDVAATVERFHAALEGGDSLAALALLADDVVILESGTRESRNDYRARHLPADIAFARAVPSRRGVIAVQVRGDVAWVTGTSTSQGEYRGRAVNSTGVELMVLSRDGAGWKIRAIHWSSRSSRSGG
jgi:ketosteroid isomerase-like protein